MNYATLEHVAMEARPYPANLLEGCETGLVLFAAAFLGHNDAIHFAEAGLRCTCVDTDVARCDEMMNLYPDDWHFVYEDAWAAATTLRMYGAQWDAVSADTFTGDAMWRSLDTLDLWCSLARKFVTVTITNHALNEGHPHVPEGWKSALYERAAGVYWLVLTPR